MKNAYDVVRNPLLTEKGQVLQASQNKFLFKVDVQANKTDIKEAIEKIYSVKVEKVHTMHVRGKLKRVRYDYGKTPAWKKAIVTLKKGSTIDFT